MWDAGMEEVEEYITQWQNMVIQYDDMQLVIGLCEEKVRQKRVWVYTWWCYQEGLVMEKARTTALRAGKTEGMEVDVKGVRVWGELIKPEIKKRPKCFFFGWNHLM